MHPGSDRFPAVYTDKVNCQRRSATSSVPMCKGVNITGVISSPHQSVHSRYTYMHAWYTGTYVCFTIWPGIWLITLDRKSVIPSTPLRVITQPTGAAVLPILEFQDGDWAGRSISLNSNCARVIAKLSISIHVSMHRYVYRYAYRWNVTCGCGNVLMDVWQYIKLHAAWCNYIWQRNSCGTIHTGTPVVVVRSKKYS